MKTNKFQKIVVSIIFAWLIFFVFAPNFLVFIVSFLSKDASDFYALPFTLENYTRLIEPLYGTVVWNSLYMSVITTVLCLVIGYPFAFMMTKIDPKYRPLLMFLLVLPFWTNSLIRIYGMKIFLGVKGILNEFLLSIGLISEPIRILNTEVAVIIGLVYLLLPFMILPLYSAIEKLDLRLLEAAKDLGANVFQRFVKIIIPLTMPGIVSGCLLVLLPAMGMFYVADKDSSNNKPKVLLLDESLSALDYKLRKQMQNELKSLQRQLGITFIFVTHDQEEALTMSDRIIVLRKGNIEQDGSPREIYEEPRNLFVAKFIGEINIFDATVIERVDTKRVRANVEGRICDIYVDQEVQPNQKLKVLLRPEDVLLEELDENEQSSKIIGHIRERNYKGMTLESTVELDHNGKIVLVSEFFNEDDPNIDHSLDQKVGVTWIEKWEVVLNDEDE